MPARWTLARAHARSGDPVAIAAYLGKSDGFDRSIADFSERYADQNEKDYEAFVEAVRSGRLEAIEGRMRDPAVSRIGRTEHREQEVREMSEKDTLIVLGASYDSVADAEVDYEAVKALYDEAGVGHDVRRGGPRARRRRQGQGRRQA